MDGFNLDSLIEQQDLDGINKFLTMGGDINVVFENDVSPLLYAISCSAVKKEEEMTVNLDHNDNVCRSDEIILRLIRAGADLNARTKHFQNTPLISVLRLKMSYELVYELINAGSNVNATCNNCLTPLFYAIQGNYNKGLIDTLILMGANVNHIDNFRKTALLYANERADRYEIIKTLIDAGSDPNMFDEFGTSLLLELKCKNCDITNCRERQIVDLLIKNGADLKKKFFCDSSIIHLTHCNYLIMKCVEHGVSIESKDNKGYTPLMRAVRFDQFDKVKYLLREFNADPNCVDIRLQTPLHLVSLHNLHKLFPLLLYHGGNLFAENNCNKTPIDIFERRVLLYSFKMHMSLVKHFLLFIDEETLIDSCRNLEYHTKVSVHSFVDKCKKELIMMQELCIKENLTFYDFCILKRFYDSKFVNISVDKFNYTETQIQEMFPLLSELIIMRLKDNTIEKCKRDLLNTLENIIITPNIGLNNNETDSDVLLVYDCMREIAQHLNYKQLYNLFQASIQD